MKLIWSRELCIQDPWEPKFHGIFSHCESGVSFYYMDSNMVMSICGCAGNPVVLATQTNEMKIPLPRYWVVAENEGEDYLLCGEKVAISLQKNLLVHPAPEGLRNVYWKLQTSSEHLVEDSFVFDEYQISHKGEWGYSCKKDGVEIWQFSGRGYLYTDILRIYDKIFFGTAGFGGYFYILNLSTGNPILSLRTGGTTVIKQRGDLFYIYTGVGKRKSKLACINASDGRILEDIELPGIASCESVLELHENSIYTVTFQYKKGYVENAILSCISLN